MTKYVNSFRQTAPVKPDEYTLSILAVMPEAVPVSDIIGQFKGSEAGSAARQVLRQALVNMASEQLVQELEAQYG